ncbi:MAG: chloride channel protein [Spirochaetes bacterium]|nr:chloride channel protein [Spirochaetota bacterium]
MTEHSFMVVIALVIGLIGGFGAIAVRAMIKGISSLSFHGGGSILDNIVASPWYVKLLAPALGGCIVGPMIYFFAREAKGHGVPEVMQSILLRGGAIRPRVAFIKALASSITIGTGGSVGREGPIVQIGASLGSSIGQFFRVSSQRMKTFVGCGAAAGIAAAFNAPVAGALFAVEIILGDFALTQFSPIVISSVTATVVSHQFEGNFAAFRVPAYQLKSPYELLFYFALGLICALIAVAFIKVLYYLEGFFEQRVRIPEYLHPLLGGLAVGVMALVFPQVMGVGYDTINDALHGNLVWYLAATLILFKILATSITLGSGGSGGIFAPSLFLGAMAGCAFGYTVHLLFPEITASPGAYALVAMGGLVAGATHAPITAIIIVFELTNEYHIILPLMITCILATIVSQKIMRESIYTLKLVQRNIHIKNGAETNIMKSIFVKDVFTRHVEPVSPGATFDQVVNSLVSGKDPYSPVLDGKGRIRGMILLQDLKDFLFDRETLQNVLIASDIARTDIETVSPDDDCQKVLDLLSRTKLDGLPVTAGKEDKRILGMVWRRDILDAYNKEIERRDISSSFASRITMANADKGVHFMEGYAISEIPIPKLFIGKSIRQLGIRGTFGVDVLLIRTSAPRGPGVKAIPDPDYVFSEGDSLVIAGEIGKINLLKSRI